MGASLLVLGLLSAVARAGCPDRTALLDTLDRQVLEGRFDQAELTQQALVAALGCGPVAEPALVARLWLAEAVMRSARSDPSASELFAAAARLSPGTWTEAYGPTLRKQWEEAAGLPQTGVDGTIRIEPLYPGTLAALDGTVRGFPATVDAGPHLLQVGPAPSDMAAALRFDLPSGIDLVLDPKLPPPALTPVPARGRDLRGRRILHALLVGGVGAAAYAVTFATEAAFYEPPKEERSAELRAVNDGIILGSAAIGTVSAVMLVRGIASPSAGGGS